MFLSLHFIKIFSVGNKDCYSNQKQLNKSGLREKLSESIQLNWSKLKDSYNLSTLSHDYKVLSERKHNKNIWINNVHFYSHEDIKKTSVINRKLEPFESTYINDFKSLVGKDNKDCSQSQDFKLQKIQNAYCIDKKSVFWKSAKKVLLGSIHNNSDK